MIINIITIEILYNRSVLLYINIKYKYIYKEIYSKELAYMVLGSGKSKICNVGLQVFRPGEPVVQMKPKGSLMENFLLLREASLFVLLIPLTDWRGPPTL